MSTICTSVCIYVDSHHPLFVVCSAKCFKNFARSLIQQPFKMIVTKMANDGLYLADYYIICWKEVKRPPVQHLEAFFENTLHRITVYCTCHYLLCFSVDLNLPPLMRRLTYRGCIIDWHMKLFEFITLKLL